MNYSTKIEILNKVYELYCDISRITSQIDLEQDGYVEIADKREQMLNEVISLQSLLPSLPNGADAEQIVKRQEEIKSLAISIFSETATLIEKSRLLHASMKKELSKISTMNKAARSYAAYK